MPKLYGEMVADNKMQVNMISWSGNKLGGVEVEEVLEGEGIHYVDPTTGRQWYETEGEPTAKSELEQVEEKLAELQALLQTLADSEGHELDD